MPMPRLLRIPSQSLPALPERMTSPWHGAPCPAALAAREAAEAPGESGVFAAPQGRRGLLLARDPSDADRITILAAEEPFREPDDGAFETIAENAHPGARLPRADAIAGVTPDEAFEAAARRITMPLPAGGSLGLLDFARSERAKRPAKIARGGTAGLNLTLGHWNRALLDALAAPLVANLLALGRINADQPAQRRLVPVASIEWWTGPVPSYDVKWSGMTLSARTTVKPLAERLLEGVAFESDPRADSPVTASLRPEILLDASDFVAIGKPSGLLSVPGTGGLPDALTLTSGMIGAALTAVHRLDMDTSGILLYAKTPEGVRRLMAAFREGRVKKRYRALLLGNLAAPSGRVDFPITTHPLDRLRQIAAAGGRPASTLWRRVAAQNGRTLVDLHPLTGRTHQLRMHAAHPLGLGAPIAGDPYYSPAGMLADTPETPLCLHAAEIRFPDPARPDEPEAMIRIELAEPFGL